MNKEKIDVICRLIKPNDEVAIIEKIILACELFNGAQYLSKAELNEKVSFLKKRIEDKMAHPEAYKKQKNSVYSALVAEVDKKIVGCIIIHKLDKSERLVPDASYELDGFYVLPEYQGKGIGYTLWNALLNKLRKEKVLTLQLAVVYEGPTNKKNVRSKGNINAIRFYQRQGCIFLDKTRQWQSKTGIPKSKLCIQRYLLKRISNDT